jgi:tRNA-specific 2-thiouridylase
MNCEKVICAMSGGIDSGVACFLLKENGYDVIGVFLDLIDSKEFARARVRAEKICKKLDVPFMALDVRKEFQKKIIDNFIKEIKQGRTPNPCVLCNKEIKIDLLLKKLKALKIDFDFVATGHYARLRQKSRNRGYDLLKAKDKGKDQSYFLWMLKQKELNKVLFPIGDYTKQKIKKIAEKIGISRFSKKESQDICFVGKDINDFLKKYIELKPGKIINQNGEILSKHQGLHFYTIGQRKSIGLSGGPYYVLDKDIKKNILIVSKNEKDLDKSEVLIKSVNWISGNRPKLSLRVKAKIRYHHEPAFGILKYQSHSKNYKFVFDKPQRAITPGQSVVFYNDANLLGGGIIK